MTHRTIALLLLALAPLGCESIGAKAEPAVATTTRVADTAGVVVLFLCDQAEASAVEYSETQQEYNRKVERIRGICNPVADAYEVARTAGLAAVAAMRLVDNCQAKGAACTGELAAMAASAGEALAATHRAVGTAQRAVKTLQVSK